MNHITSGKYKDFLHCDHYYPIGNDGRYNKCDFCGIEKQILSIEKHFDKESYLLGQKANEIDKNPFFKNTNSWYNWNRGKNENLLNKTQCKDKI